jgi:alpha-beta hydrolase superfamily lysophospholipase
MYFFQEKLIFIPQKLAKDYAFEFDQKFEELDIKTDDNVSLHGILFKADSSKGLIFYLHGNAGSLASWGTVARTYTDMNYDVFLLDYRGYGKSDGTIDSEALVYSDVQAAYKTLKEKYDESNIVVLGYSIGTGPAAELASSNHPKLLILQAPYYSLTDLMEHTYSFVPTFLLKYKFETYRYVKDCQAPIVIFHGDRDEIIYYNSSVKLKEFFKPNDQLITLVGQGHNGMTRNKEYVSALKKIL